MTLVIHFRADCPACGEECWWTQNSSRTTSECGCTDAPRAGDGEVPARGQTSP